ncbi:MAG: hypothetical protein HC904_06365 [Blastochloris sp.]|nr:hypothetical protein [Blastochloris sp.]
MNTSTTPPINGIVVAIEGQALRLVATDITEIQAHRIIQELDGQDIDSAFFPVPSEMARRVVDTLNSAHCVERMMA